MPAARAFPPMRPSATAAAFLPSSVVTSPISPVAILAIMTARALTSAGGFWPLGPFGIAGRLLLGGKHSTPRQEMERKSIIVTAGDSGYWPYLSGLLNSIDERR